MRASRARSGVGWTERKVYENSAAERFRIESYERNTEALERRERRRRERDTLIIDVNAGEGRRGTRWSRQKVQRKAERKRSKKEEKKRAKREKMKASKKKKKSSKAKQSKGSKKKDEDDSDYEDDSDSEESDDGGNSSSSYEEDLDEPRPSPPRSRPPPKKISQAVLDQQKKARDEKAENLLG